MAENKTQDNGQALIDDLRSWIGSYVSLTDPAHALVLAIWAVATWEYMRYYSFPYLQISSLTKGSGKTTTLEVLQRIVMGGKTMTAATPAVMYRMLEGYKGKLTILFDEAEITSRELKDVMSMFLNTGYRKGGTIPRTVAGETVEFSTYCPKAFALIGDTSGTVRDRSIVIDLIRRTPKREFLPWEADPEALVLTDRIKALLQTIDSFAPIFPSHLRSTRDREVWGAMFGMAKSLELNKTTINELISISSDIAGSKTADKRSNLDRTAELDAIEAQYGPWALADLRRVLKQDERGIFSADAVERMKALPDGPWRTYRGKGLDQTFLASLLAHAGLEPKLIKMKGKPSRGYVASEVRAANSSK